MNKHILALALGLSPLVSSAAPAKSETLKVDASKTQIDWEAKKVTGKHNGSLKVKDGELKVENGKLTGGNFNIDMTSITVTDIQDADSNQKLVGHLKSEDFFSVEKNSTAKFAITKVEAIAKAKPNEANHKVSGKLTIKGIEKAISFPAWVDVTDGKASAKATITVDRTAYDIRYGSKKFFGKIGDKAIDDKFKIDLKLAAAK